MMKTQRHKYSHQAGLSLIEVLVSVVVLSIGLLGMAGLQSTAYRVNHDSFLRATAISQVNTIIDRMRTNRQAISAGSFNQFPIPNSPPVTAKKTCAQCTPAQLAAIDFNNWNIENQNLLPSGRGTIAGNGTVFTITVMYDKDRTGATGTNCSGNSQNDLYCVRVNVEL